MNKAAKNRQSANVNAKAVRAFAVPTARNPLHNHLKQSNPCTQFKEPFKVWHRREEPKVNNSNFLPVERPTLELVNLAMEEVNLVGQLRIIREFQKNGLEGTIPTSKNEEQLLSNLAKMNKEEIEALRIETEKKLEDFPEF